MSVDRTRILVVDDEPAMRAMAKAMIESMGFETVLANSGEQAVDIYHQSLLGEEANITMAIMDLTLPGGISGVEALQELQDLDGELPVVATSGYLEENAFEICQQIGFVGVLPKPYTADKLRHLIQWVVSRKGVPGGYSEGMPGPDPKPEKVTVKVEEAESQVADDEEGGPAVRTMTAQDIPVQSDSSDPGALGAQKISAGTHTAYSSGIGIAERLGELAEIAGPRRAGNGE